MHELTSIIDIFNQPPVPEKAMGLVVNRLERVIEIFKVLVQQFNVLETMYPTEFLEFRSFLVPASGFQSRQFRVWKIDWDCELICVCSINAQCTKSFFTMKIESIWKQ